MKNIKNYILLITLLIVCYGCNEDQFSQIRTIDLPTHESRLAVTSHIGHGDTLPSVFVANSLGIIEEAEYDSIYDADVKLYKDGVLFLNFEFDPASHKYFPDASNNLPLILEDGIYQMEVSAPNYDPVTATQVLPKTASILNATYRKDAVPTDFGEIDDLLEVKIKDDGSEENFYVFNVFAQIKYPGGGSHLQHLYSYSDDPLIEYGYDYEILPDQTFNGNEYLVRLVLENGWSDQQGDVEFLVIDVISVTKDFYRYEISREVNSVAIDNPFTEPVLVHSNFENGYGVFTIRKGTTFILEF